MMLDVRPAANQNSQFLERKAAEKNKRKAEKTVKGYQLLTIYSLYEMKFLTRLDMLIINTFGFIIQQASLEQKIWDKDEQNCSNIAAPTHIS